MSTRPSSRLVALAAFVRGIGVSTRINQCPAPTIMAIRGPRFGVGYLMNLDMLGRVLEMRVGLGRGEGIGISPVLF